MAAHLAVNTAQPQGYLKYPGQLSDEAVTRLRESWAEVTRRNGDGTPPLPVLEEGTDFVVAETPNVVESAMTASLEWGASDVARLFGIPPTMIGLQKDSNRASSVEEARQFLQRCARPWSARVGDAVSRLLLTPAERAKGLACEFDLTEMALGFGKERAEFVSQLVNSGVLTGNEGRNNLGYPDAERLADKLRAPVNTTYLDRIGAQQDAGTSTA
jgi:HK97 family phage portal protein